MTDQRRERFAIDITSQTTYTYIYGNLAVLGLTSSYAVDASMSRKTSFPDCAKSRIPLWDDGFPRLFSMFQRPLLVFRRLGRRALDTTPTPPYRPRESTVSRRREGLNFSIPTVPKKEEVRRRGCFFLTRGKDTRSRAERCEPLFRF